MLFFSYRKWYHRVKKSGYQLTEINNRYQQEKIIYKWEKTRLKKKAYILCRVSFHHQSECFLIFFDGWHRRMSRACNFITRNVKQQTEVEQNIYIILNIISLKFKRRVQEFECVMGRMKMMKTQPQTCAKIIKSLKSNLTGCHFFLSLKSSSAFVQWSSSSRKNVWKNVKRQ